MSRTLKTFTAFCCDSAGNHSTTWIQSVEAFDVNHALKVALADCADAWECDPDSVRVMGIAEGDIRILHWEDAPS